MREAVIIGSGLGGLSCGVVLAKNGYHVTVLEQGTQIGGCLQCFTRRGEHFETGMHFIGSAGEGQTLDRLFRFLGIQDDLHLSPLDREGYDVVSIGGKQYKFACGREAFIRQMAEYFPDQRDNLERYYDLVERVAYSSSLHSMSQDNDDSAVHTEYQLRTIPDVIDSIITDPLLAKVLVGNLPLYAAERDKTPFATHAFIMDFYNQGAYRFIGGSAQVADALSRQISQFGGQVLTRSKATRILCDDVRATGVEVNGEQVMEADIVISDIHPSLTLQLLDTHLIRKAYRKRINSIPNTISNFALYLHFKDGSMPYMNHNFYSFNQGTPWGCEEYDALSWPKGYLYMHFCNAQDAQHARTGVVLSYMKMEDVKQWEQTTVGHRGADYENFKRERAERLLDVLERDFPDIRKSIAHYYTSTPLTYRDYTGTVDGSIYGVAKDINMGAAGRVPYKTKVPNLLLTGQNINSHGMLGVLVGTIVTCSGILGRQTLFNQIIEANR